MQEVKSLSEMIAEDRRHCEFQKLHEGIVSGDGLFLASPLAFALPNDDLIVRIAASKGSSAVSVLCDAVDRLDMTL